MYAQFVLSSVMNFNIAYYANNIKHTCLCLKLCCNSIDYIYMKIVVYISKLAFKLNTNISNQNTKLI